MRRKQVSNWVLISASTAAGALFGAVIPIVLVAASAATDGPANSSQIVWLIAAFAALLGGVSGLAAGLATGLVAAATAVLTARLRVRTPIIAMTSAAVASSVVYTLASRLLGEDGAFPGSLALAAGGIAAVGTALLWSFGGSCRLCRMRDAVSA